MPVTTTRGSLRLISGAFSGMIGSACVIGLASAMAIAQSAGTSSAVTTAPKAGSAISQSMLDQARAALDAGRVVEAQAMLRRMISKADIKALGSADMATALDLRDRADRKIKATDATEVELQRAELLASEGELVQAENTVVKVSKSSTLTLAQKDRIAALKAGNASARQSLAPMVKDSITRSVAAFEAGRYAEAKSGFGMLVRSGVQLSEADRDLVDTHQMSIVELEREQGKAFASSDFALGMMQPGTVRKSPSETPAPAAAPAAAPAPAPAPAPTAAPAPVAATPVQVIAASQPPATPPPAAEPTTTNGVLVTPATQSIQPTGGDDILTLAMKAEAQRLVAEADQAFTDRRYSEALRKYRLALTSGRKWLTSEEISLAESKAADCEIAMRGSGNLSDTFVGQFDLIRQQTQAEFDNAIAEAEKALAAGEINQARTQLASSGLTIDRSKQYFSQGEIDAFAKKRNDLSAKIGVTEEKNKLDTQTKNAANTAKDEATRRATLAAEKDRRIRESLTRVRALQQEQKYAEALQVVDQVLFLDPNNPAAQLLKEVLLDIEVFRSSEKLEERKSRNMQKFTTQNREAYIPPTGPINYPENWPTKTYQRSDSGSYLETPENRRTIGLLDKAIPAQFNGNSLAQVKQYIERTCGVDIDVDWVALETIGVHAESPIHLILNNATPAKVVLDRALAKASRDPGNRPVFTIADGIIAVGTLETINQHKVTQPYNVTDLMLLLDIPTYDDVPNMDLAAVINGSKSGRGVTPFNSGGKRVAKNERLDRDEKMHRLVSLVQNSIDPDGWRDRGGNSGAIEEINGNLIITTTPANHREITGLLSKLRELKSMQINVESRFLTVNQDFFEQIGFDIDVYFNTGSNQVSAAQSLDPNVLPSDFFDFRRSFGADVTGTPQAPLRRVLDSNTYAPAGSVTPILVPPGTADRALQNSAAPNNFSPIGAGQNSLGIAESLAGGFSPFAQSVLSTAPALGIAGQFLDDVQVDFLIKATQADRRSTTLTAPRLTLTNGQTANVVVGTQRSFVGDLTPVTGDSAVGFDPDPQVLTEGVTLQVEAVISSDRRYVTLNIDTAVSQAQQPFRQVAVTAAVAGQLQNSGTTQSFIELPTVNTTRVQTTVTVPDEGTVLLGGQRIISEVETESGVPILSKLPIINRFFTNRVQAKNESTLLILVKPTILIQTEEEEKNFPGLGDAVRSGMTGL